MSKELEALKEVGNHKIKYDVNIKYYNGNETHLKFENIRGMFPNQFALIETALKENNELKENLKKACKKVNEYGYKLKALEIIKEKKWLVEDILNAFIEDKEKYDLLKEVLL